MKTKLSSLAQAGKSRSRPKYQLFCRFQYLYIAVYDVCHNLWFLTSLKIGTRSSYIYTERENPNHILFLNSLSALSCFTSLICSGWKPIPKNNSKKPVFKLTHFNYVPTHNSKKHFCLKGIGNKLFNF